jgi:DNA-binding beta-propeller fold protein YncE
MPEKPYSQKNINKRFLIFNDMKKILIHTFCLSLLLLVCGSANAQKLKPVIQFEDESRTHNVHLASDGQYLYTVNGGKSHLGQISKFSLAGEFINSFDIDLDMRSLMYNAKENQFYVCTYERNIYKITDMERGSYELVLSQMYDDEQANLAMSPSGKLLYYFFNGQLNIYKFPSGKLIKILYGFDGGKDFSTGNGAVAVDEKYLYTWDAAYQTVFIYTLKGKKVKSVTLSDGDYGFSLSAANGMIWVSFDGNYETGKWFGYRIPEE